MTIDHVSTVAAPLEVVARVIRGERYNVENQTQREDVVEAHYELLAEDDAETRYDLHQTTYARTRSGGIDRSRTERSKTEYRWVEATQTLHWTFVGGQDERADVRGVTRLTAQGERTRVQRTVNIDIRIPVIGRGIAKIVEREFRKGIERSAALLDRIAREET